MIRVLRVLEYTYINGEEFVRDSARWTNYQKLRFMEMQGATVSVTVVEPEKEGSNEDQ